MKFANELVTSLVSATHHGWCAPRTPQTSVRLTQFQIVDTWTGAADATPLDSAPEMDAVYAFAERLAMLPASAWLEVGYLALSGSANGSRAAQRATSAAALDATIAAKRLDLLAWYARDAVDTAAQVVAHTVTRWSAMDRRAFAAARATAKEMALALLARECLPSEEFRLLHDTLEHAIAATA